MHDYTPPRENNASLIVPILLFVGSAVSFAAASLNIGFRLIWQLAAMVMLVAGIQITTRYRLATLTYVVDDNTAARFEDELNRVTQSWGDSQGLWLRVVRTQGKSSRTVAGFPVTAVMSVKKRGEPSEHDREVRLAYNYCNNLMPKKAYTLILTLNGQLMRVTLEPDEYILSLLKGG